MRKTTYLSASDAARSLGVLPRVLSDAFYQGKLDAARCPIVGDRRIIPTDYLPAIRRVLKQLGRLPEPATASA